jgi:hypothetical protein
MAPKRLCSIEGCGKPHYGRGMCSRHYQRAYHGLAEPGPKSEPKYEWLLRVAVPYAGDDCLIWPFARGGDGRGHVAVNGRVMLAHRVVCALVHGEQPADRPLAAHSCGNGHLGCVSPKHLRWATYLDNSDDMERHGTTNRTARFPVLPPETIRMIRSDPRPQKVIAQIVGISPGAVGFIRRRHTYKHVT